MSGNSGLSVNNININLVNVTQTGQTNIDNTKNLIQLRYVVLNNQAVLDPGFAADSINQLNVQTMATDLGSEIVNKGYSQTSPYISTVTVSQPYWIIGAVLGPIVFLITLVWIVAFVYFKCINPRRETPSKDEKIVKESPTSVNFFFFLIIKNITNNAKFK